MRPHIATFLSVLIFASTACVSVSVSSTTDPSNRGRFIAAAHLTFANAGFPVADDELRGFLADTCLIAESGTDADFEEFIRGVRAGAPPEAFKKVAEEVARRARTSYCSGGGS